MTSVISTLFIIVVSSIFVIEVQRKTNSFERKIIGISFIIHILSTFILLYVYMFHYGYGDMLTYQRQGVLLSRLLELNFNAYTEELILVFIHQQNKLGSLIIGNGNSTGSMIALSGFINFFTRDSIVATSLVFSILTFSGQVAMYRGLSPELDPSMRRKWIIGAMLTPSLVFWTSGILKEAIACFGMGWAIYGFIRFLRGKRRIVSLIIFLVALPFVIMVKGYIFLVLVLSVGIYFIKRQILSMPNIKGLVYVVFASTIAITVILVMGYFFPRFELSNFADEAVRMQEVGSKIEGGSNIEVTQKGERSFVGQIAYAPIALMTTLFRPFIFEAHNLLSLVNSLETTALLCLFILILFSGIRKKVLQIWKSPVLLMMAVFILLFSVGVGTTTTNLGTLSRYRVPMMPFYLTLLLILAPKVKLKRA